MPRLLQDLNFIDALSRLADYARNAKNRLNRPTVFLERRLPVLRTIMPWEAK